MEPEDLDAAVERTEAFARTLVGKREDDARAAAEAAGFTVRIADRDGTAFALKRDLQPWRINFSIEAGSVTAVFVA